MRRRHGSNRVRLELAHNKMRSLLHRRRDQAVQIGAGQLTSHKLNCFVENEWHRVRTNVTAQFGGRHFFGVGAQTIQCGGHATLRNLSCQRVVLNVCLMYPKDKHDVIPQLV
jgi:hypothetical protein